MLVLRGSLKTAYLHLISEENVFGYEFFDAELFGPRCLDQTQAPFDKLCSRYIDVPPSIEHSSGATCLPIIEEKEQRDGRLTGFSQCHDLILHMTPHNSTQYMRIGDVATSSARDRKWLSDGEEQHGSIVSERLSSRVEVSSSHSMCGIFSCASVPFDFHQICWAVSFLLEFND